MVIAASDPAALASLTATAGSGGQSASVSPVTTSNVLTFNPPIVVNPGAAVSFTVTAQTASGAAALARRVVYASMVELGGDRSGRSGPLAPLGGGLLMLGLTLIPLGRRTRRRAALIAFGGLLLAVALAGCGNSSSSHPSGYSATVFGSGAISQVVPLSTVSVTSGAGSVVTVQQLTALGFE